MSEKNCCKEECTCESSTADCTFKKKTESHFPTIWNSFFSNKQLLVLTVPPGMSLHFNSLKLSSPLISVSDHFRLVTILSARIKCESFC